MIVENSQDNIVIDIPGHFNKIGLKISGGADSAIVAFMLCKYITESEKDCTIIPITVNYAGKAFQTQFAAKVLTYLKNNFKVKIGKHYTDINYEFDTYSQVQDSLVQRLYKEKAIDCHFSGITANPPKEVQEQFDTRGPMDSRDRERDKKPQIRGNTFFPLINIDKQGVKELYEKFGVLDTLFPLTRSCESFTDDFSKHCGEYRDWKDHCWFCKERYWGFDRYN